MEYKIWNGLTVYEDGTVIGKKGKEIGTINNSGYKVIGVNYGYKNIILAHRLIYELFIGEIQKDMVIDHIDSNKLNNHYTNLQLITQRSNCSKKEEKKGKSSKYTGVSFHKKTKQWRATIMNGKKENGKQHRVHLGLFNNEENARDAYVKYKEIYNL